MKTRSFILLAGAITLAAATALVARALMRPPPPVTIIKQVETPRPPSRQVLAASRSLAPGDFISGETLSWQDMPAENARAGQLTAAGDTDRRQLERELYGATLRHPVTAGMPLTRDALVYAGEPGFLAAVLAPGMRAVSIPTSVVASNAGLVNAGDRVDVILSLDREALSPPSDAPNSTYAALASQTIVRDVRVLALNSNTTSIAPPANASEPDAKRNGNAGSATRSTTSARVNYESLTLEVSPAQAEQLALAREVGTLQASLRGTRDGLANGTALSSGVTRLGDTTAIFGAAAKRPVTVQTFQGAQQGQQVFGNTP